MNNILRFRDKHTMTTTIANIVLDLPIPQAFSYRIKNDQLVQPGIRVRVPFGTREKLGIVLTVESCSEAEAERLKEIAACLDVEPILSFEIMQLIEFCSQYYHYPMGATLFTALPATFRQLNRRKSAQKKAEQYILTEQGLQQAGSLPTQARVQQALWIKLKTGAVLSSDCNIQEKKIIKRWLEQRWIQTEQTKAPSSPALQPLLALNTAQQQVYAAIQHTEGTFSPFLLHGVTGSGKTEIFAHLVQHFQPKQILILVPEIRLATQMETRLRRYFAAHQLVVLHSDRPAGQRIYDWQQASAGGVSVIIGTRMAIFTPLPDLGLIIVDEEHDSAYFQQDGLRYAARDVAIVRAQRKNCPIVLASATPALESWYNAKIGRYHYLPLLHRARKATLPSVQLLDTRVHKTPSGLALEMEAAIQQRLDIKQQSLIYVNRRGYAPALYCHECGWAAQCHRCSVRLVMHVSNNTLRCHHCGYQEKMKSACPECGNLDLHPGGFGTQRLEQYLRQRFPAARVLRIDQDTAQGEQNWQSMQDAIQTGNVDILVGTQMIGKGHDFPNLTLVAVVGADDALYSTDFRVSERLFAQIMQVGGRAGRAQQAGQVIIQTRFPQHPLYQALQQHDYVGYAEILLSERKQAGFPPFVYQAVLRADAPTMERALDFLQRAKNVFSCPDAILSFDPIPDNMPRKAGRERALLLVQAAHRKKLQEFLRQWAQQIYTLPKRGVHWHLDVDPLQL